MITKKPSLCKSCPRYHLGQGYAKGIGPLDSKLLILGEQPGSEEVAASTPFIGPTGKHLNRAIEMAGEKRENIRLDNALRCGLPQKSKIDEDRKIRKESIEYCQSKHLPCIDHKTVLVLGADALEAVTKLTTPTRYHGSVWIGNELGYPYIDQIDTIVASLHPAYALRGAPHFLPHIYNAIGRAIRWSKNPNLPSRRLDKLDLTGDPGRIHDFLCVILPGTAIAVDVETPRDKPTEIEICSIATSPMEVISFPWHELTKNVCARTLMRQDIIIGGHNFNYDVKAFEANGIKIKKWWDTIDMNALLWPPPSLQQKSRHEQGGREFPWHNIFSCASRVLDDIVYWKEPKSEYTKHYYSVAYSTVPSWQYPRLYCALDSIYALRMYLKFNKLLELQEML